jgi:hypothetical protein
MHSHLKIIFKDILNWLPNSFVEKILSFAAYSDQKKKFSSIYKKLSENKRMSLVGKYPRCTQYDLVESLGVEQILKPQSIEKVCFPEIANLASDCYVKILHGPIKLHQLVDVSLFYKSDVIVGNGVALWEKFFKPQFSHTLPIDYNLATFDYTFRCLSKNDNSLASQYGSVSEPRWRGSPLNSGLDPATRIQIEDVCVIQVSVAIDFASVEMTLQI